MKRAHNKYLLNLKAMFHQVGASISTVLVDNYDYGF